MLPKYINLRTVNCSKSAQAEGLFIVRLPTSCGYKPEIALKKYLILKSRLKSESQNKLYKKNTRMNHRHNTAITLFKISSVCHKTGQ